MYAIYNLKVKRKVWLADSFKGFPQVDTKKFKQDIPHSNDLKIEFKNSLSLVKSYFNTLGLLDHNLVFLEGFFNETLPSVKNSGRNSFSVIRFDGDLYESTIESFYYLYPLLSVGGYVIVDDYTDWIGCREATHDYRKACGIKEPITAVFHRPKEQVRGVYWKKTRQVDPECWKMNF